MDTAYLEAGHVAHGDAITGHKAQGPTVDHTFVLGSAELYRAWGYVALSRGRLQAPDIARQGSLTSRRAELAKDRRFVIEQLGYITQRLENAGNRLGRLRNRPLLAQLRRDHDTYTGRRDGLDDQLREVDAELVALPSDRHIVELQDQRRRLASPLHRAASRRIVGYRDTCPDHLTTAHGPPRADSRGRDRWEQAAFAIEKCRLRWNITDPQSPLGREPSESLQRKDYQQAVREVEHARHELHTERAPVRALRRGLSR